MNILVSLFCWLALAAKAEGQTSPSRYEEPKYLTGAIYDSGTKELLFRFKRTANRSGSTLHVERDYTYPDGKLAAQERVVYEGDALVFYELDELQIGAKGSAEIQRDTGRIDFEYEKKQGIRASERTETLEENTLINDMVGPFLVSHWDALQRGEKVKCRYIVVPRKETVAFTFSKDAESTWQGRDVLIVKMEASNRFIAALVKPLYFTMDKTSPHHVLQYAGRTTPKIRVDGKWKDLDAVTVFDWDSSH